MANNESDFVKEDDRTPAKADAGLQSIAASVWSAKSLGDVINKGGMIASSVLPDFSLTNTIKENASHSGKVQNSSVEVGKELRDLFSNGRPGLAELGLDKHSGIKQSSYMIQKLKDFQGAENRNDSNRSGKQAGDNQPKREAKPSGDDSQNRGSNRGAERDNNQQQQEPRQEGGSNDGKRRPEEAEQQNRPTDDGRDNAERPQAQLNEREQRLYDRMAERGASPADLRTFHEDLVKLRERGLSPQEVSRTLDQVERLMNSQGERPASQTERRNIAMQIVHHAARPSEIDQGNHNTCNVTTAEERMFTRTPSRAAEMIVSAATTGSWTAPDGRRIELDARSFVPGAEERRTYPNDGERSHASQIFQIVAANEITQRREPPQFYRQEAPTGANDTGERLVYANGRPVMETVNGVEQRVSGPSITSSDLAAQGRRLTGDSGYVLSHSDFAGGPGVSSINSRETLVTTVQDLARRGQLPATVHR